MVSEARRLGTHEAGHVLLAWIHGMDVERVVIRASIRSGFTRLVDAPSDPTADLAFRLAGAEAERLLVGDVDEHNLSCDRGFADRAVHSLTGGVDAYRAVTESWRPWVADQIRERQAVVELIAGMLVIFGELDAGRLDSIRRMCQVQELEWAGRSV